MKLLSFALLLILAVSSRTAVASVIVIVDDPLLDANTALLPLPCLEIFQQENLFENTARSNNSSTAGFSVKDDLQYVDDLYGYEYNYDGQEDSPLLGIRDHLTTLFQLSEMLCEQGATAYQAGQTFLDRVAVAWPIRDGYAVADSAGKYGNDAGSGDDAGLWCCLSGDEYRYWTNVEQPRATAKGIVPFLLTQKSGQPTLAVQLARGAFQSLGNWNTAIQHILLQIAPPDCQMQFDGQTTTLDGQVEFIGQSFVRP